MMGIWKGRIIMRFTLAYVAIALLASPAFAGNDKNYTYLALGDSIPFGLNAVLLPPYSNQIPSPAAFVGYPEVIAAAENLLASKKEVNAACPGETSGSFLNTASPDNGCNSPHFEPPATVIPPFKSSIGLHTAYAGAQMDFAESALKSNKHINMVTLSIGANDGLMVLPALQQCGVDSVCAQTVLGPVLQAYGVNLAQILTRIRAQYRGTLILVKYYSPSPALDGFTVAFNNVMTDVAAQLAAQPNFTPVIFADGFTAFQLASALFNHDACKAGLLIRLPPSPLTAPCDIHPSRLGRELLAITIEFAKWSKH